MSCHHLPDEADLEDFPEDGRCTNSTCSVGELRIMELTPTGRYLAEVVDGQAIFEAPVAVRFDEGIEGEWVECSHCLTAYHLPDHMQYR